MILKWLKARASVCLAIQEGNWCQGQTSHASGNGQTTDEIWIYGGDTAHRGQECEGECI